MEVVKFSNVYWLLWSLGFFPATALTRNDTSKSISYRFGKDCFLPYMIQLKQEYCLKQANHEEDEEKHPFLSECQTMQHAFTYYNKLVYRVVCGSCTSRSCQCDHRCFNVSCSCDVDFCTSCGKLLEVIYLYIEAEIDTSKLRAVNEFRDQLSYKEVILHDVPFCFSISVPSIAHNKRRNSSVVLSAFDSMSCQCQLGFYLVLIIDSVLSFAIAITNGFVIIVAIKHAFLKSPGGCFSMSLACADAVVGVVTHPCTMINVYRQYKDEPANERVLHSNFYLLATGLIQTASMSSSLMTLIILTTFRYIALAKPFIYHRRRKKLNLFARRLVLCVWITSISLGAVTALKMIPGDRFFVHHVGMTLSKRLCDFYIYPVIIVLSFFVLWFIYAKIHFVMQRSTKRKKNVTKNFVHTLKAMIVAFSVCYLPLAVVQSFQDVPAINLKDSGHFSPIANVLWNSSMWFASRLVVLNSVLNCVIYNRHNKYVVQEIRALHALLRKGFFRRKKKNNSNPTL